jgi:DNA-binding Lrp family transcriptional regulator
MELDATDRRLIEALQVDGRAPFSLIGEVLGVSDQTVARRYRKLRAGGAVRVLATTDAHLLGEAQWCVRAKCSPDTATRVAEALARRTDTSWVNIVAGGTEIVCAARAQSDVDTDQLLLRDFPRTPRVADVSAQRELHVFHRGSTHFLRKSGDLSAAQIAALTPDLAADAEVTSLDAVDKALAAVLVEDGRAGIHDLAAATATSPSTVERRLRRLRSTGALQLVVDIDRRALGLAVRTLMWATVSPSDLEATGRELASHPEVAFAAATTGRTNLYASVLTRDVASFYSYLTTRVGAIRAIRDVETAPCIREIKTVEG